MKKIQAAFKGGETDVVALFDKVGQQIVGLAEQPAGSGLGWLIDAEAKHVFVFQAEKAPFSLDNPAFLSADAVPMGG